MMHKAKACRLGRPCSPRTFKQLLACRTQHHPMMDAETIADRAELRRDRLYAFSNDNDPGQIPLVALLRICHAIDNFDLVDFALEPYGLHSVRSALVPAPRSVLVETLDVAAATGALAAQVTMATADGVMGDDERAATRECVRQLRRQVDDVERALDQHSTLMSTIGRRA